MDMNLDKVNKGVKKGKRTKLGVAWWGVHLAAILVARCVLYGTSPFGAVFFLASYAAGVSSPLLLAEVMVGTVSVLGYTQGIKYGLVMLTGLIFIRMFMGKNRSVNGVWAATITGMATTLIGGAQIIWQRDWLHYASLSVLEGLLAFALFVIFQKGIFYLKNNYRPMNHEEAIGVAVILFTALFGIPRVLTGSFSIIESVCFFIVLYAGYRFGIKEGGMMGAVCGAVLAYQHGDIAILSGVMLLGMGASILRGFGRFGTVISFVCTGYLLRFFYDGVLLEKPALTGMAAALLIFLIMPKMLIRQVSEVREGDKSQRLFEDAAWMATKTHLREFSDSFRKLESMLKDMDNEDCQTKPYTKEQLLNRVADNFCSQCANCGHCWNEENHKTYADALSIFEALSREDGLQIKDIPPEFGETCIHLESFLMEANHSFELVLLEEMVKKRMQEGREAIAGQLKEVAQVVENYSLGLYEEEKLDVRLEADIITSLKRVHIKAKKVSILTNHQGKDDIYITARSVKGRLMTTREAASAISKVTSKPMKVANGNKAIIGKEDEVISFTQEEPYYILQGVAKSTKQNEVISGDSFSFLPLTGGKLIMMLADGMGSGENASKESENLIEMLERMLQAGFGTKGAISLLNSVLAGPIDRPIFSTLDMAQIDLYTGECEFTKIGAATTFIKREKGVEMIAGVSLPMGIFPKLEYHPQLSKLEEGDFVIMVSDGVLDAIECANKEEYMKSLLETCTISNPCEMAKLIMEQLKSNSKSKVKDDMTILVMGLWKR